VDNTPKLQVAENELNKVVALGNPSGLQYTPMKRPGKAEKRPKPIQLRPTVADYAIIAAGMKKHGLDQSQIIRMALRRFAEAEGLKAS